MHKMIIYTYVKIVSYFKQNNSIVFIKTGNIVYRYYTTYLNLKFLKIKIVNFVFVSHILSQI